MSECQHEYITSTFEKGWHCSDCGVRLLSLSMPIPMPLIERALVAVGALPPAPSPKD